MARLPRNSTAAASNGGLLASQTWEQPGTVSPFAVIGTLGLRQSSGMVWEEFEEKLRGQKAVRVYTAMATDPVCAAILWAIESALRGVEWEVEPRKKKGETEPSDAAVEAAEMVREVLFEDMATPWAQIVAEALSCLVYGYSLHEIIWRKAKDGKVGIEDISPRPQDTIIRWTFDENSAPTGFVQRHPVHGGEVIVPMTKALNFRVRHRKRDPEGVSMLRPGYKSWVYATNLINIEAIGLERDLAGLPIARVPLTLMNSAAQGDKTAQQQLQAYITMVRDLRMNQQAGIVLPSDMQTSPDGSTVGAHPLYDVQLLSAGSTRNVAADVAIRRHRSEMAMSVLADFIMLGQGATGSWALSSDKTQLFLSSLQAVNAGIAAEMQRGVVKPLCAFNGVADDLIPTLRPGAVTPPDIAALAANIAQLAAAGATMFPDTTLENAIREKMGLPPKDESQQPDTLGQGMTGAFGEGEPGAGGDPFADLYAGGDPGAFADPASAA